MFNSVCQSNYKTSEVYKMLQPQLVVAEPMSGTGQQAEFGCTVGGCKLSGVAGRDALVVFTVHHEEGPRGEALGCSNGPEATEGA